MIKFDTSMLTLTDALFIGGVFAALVIILGWLIGGWYTTSALERAEALVVLQWETITEQKTELNSLRKQANDRGWSNVQQITAAVDDW